MENELDEALSALLGGAPARDRAGAPRPAQPSNAELRRLLAAAEQVRDAFSGVPSPAARQRHLQMIAEEAAKPAGATVRVLSPTRRRISRFLLRPAAAIAASFLVVGPTTVAFAQNADPDDALYSTKLGIERFQLFVERDPVEKTRLHMRFALRRMEELAALAAEGKDDRPEVAARVLANLSSHQEKAAQKVTALEARGEAPRFLEGNVRKVLVRNGVLLQTLSFEWECIVSDASNRNPSCPALVETKKNTDETIHALDSEPGQPSDVPADTSPSPSPAPSPEPEPPRESPAPSPAPETPPQQSPAPSPESPPPPAPSPAPGSAETEPGASGASGTSRSKGQPRDRRGPKKAPESSSANVSV